MSRALAHRPDKLAAERPAGARRANAWLAPSPPPELRRQARRVAVWVALAGVVLYVLAAGIADVLVLQHLSALTDGRLAGQLRALASSPGTPAFARTGDPDDAPVFAWKVTGPTASPLVLGSPTLTGAALATAVSDTARSSATTATVAGRPFVLLAEKAASGTVLVVGTSVQQLSSTRNELIAGEGTVLPVILVAFFLLAALIGRRAAAPVELARREQLEFTADASHELRTPLSVIEAEVGLALIAERDAAGYRAALERVAGEARRLSGIVEDLMLLARADALPAQPAAEPCTLAPVVEACAARFAPLLSRSGGTLRIDVEAGSPPPAARLPAEWLDRLVSVLVDNACRYAGQDGTVLVEVDSEAGRALLRVQDSGPGIPPEQREAVTRRFHRFSSSPGGAGLGLAIARAIVESSGGRLELASSELGGASVEISWPLALPAGV